MTGTRYPQVYTRVMPYPRVKIPVDPGKPFRRNDGYPLPAIYTRVMPYSRTIKSHTYRGGCGIRLGGLIEGRANTWTRGDEDWFQRMKAKMAMNVRPHEHKPLP